MSEEALDELQDDWGKAEISFLDCMRKAFALGVASGRRLGAKNAVNAMAGLEALRHDTLPPDAERVPVIDANPEHDAEEREFLIAYTDDDGGEHFFDDERPVFVGSIERVEAYLTGLLDGSSEVTVDDLQVCELHRCSVSFDENGDLVLEAP